MKWWRPWPAWKRVVIAPLLFTYAHVYHEVGFVSRIVLYAAMVFILDAIYGYEYGKER